MRYRSGWLPVHTHRVDTHPSRWRVLSLLALAELLGMSLWLVGSAIGPQLAETLSLDTAQVG